MKVLNVLARGLTWFLFFGMILIPPILGTVFSIRYPTRKNLMVPCRNCGRSISYAKKVCPHCAAKYPSDPGTAFKGIKYRGRVFARVYALSFGILWFLMVICSVFCTTPG